MINSQTHAVALVTVARSLVSDVASSVGSTLADPIYAGALGALGLRIIPDLVSNSGTSSIPLAQTLTEVAAGTGALKLCSELGKQYTRERLFRRLGTTPPPARSALEQSGTEEVPSTDDHNMSNSQDSQDNHGRFQSMNHFVTDVASSVGNTLSNPVYSSMLRATALYLLPDVIAAQGVPTNLTGTLFKAAAGAGTLKFATDWYKQYNHKRWLMSIGIERSDRQGSGSYRTKEIRPGEASSPREDTSTGEQDGVKASGEAERQKIVAGQS